MDGPEYGINQSTATRLSALAGLLLALPGDCLRVLEIGCYEGSSALHWSHAIGNAGKRGQILCIDPWEPYIAEEEGHYGQRAMNDDLRTGTSFARFQRNITLAHASAPIRFIRGRITDAPGIYWHFDFIYIDGSHSFSDAMLDLQRAAPQLRGGGILCGDDLEAMIADEDHERRLWPLRELEWSSQYQCHPGVSLAVWKFFGRPVWVRDGAWAMKKADAAFVLPVPA